MQGPSASTWKGRWRGEGHTPMSAAYDTADKGSVPLTANTCPVPPCPARPGCRAPRTCPVCTERVVWDKHRKDDGPNVPQEGGLGERTVADAHWEPSGPEQEEALVPAG